MKIVEKLGTIAQGGFGVIDKVRLDNGEIVAKKSFKPREYSSEEELQKLRKRFIREVKIQSSLPTDFFMPILGSNLSIEVPFYLMPLAEKSLKTQILEDRLTKEINLAALCDIMNALEILHSLGFVHRDLSPGNVLFHENKWKLSDLGLVLPQRTETIQLTSVHSAWGSINYCAPEQATDFHRSTAAVDIYSFGCILHDFVTVRPRVPYNQHSTEGEIGIIISKCTNKNPKKRFKDIHLLRDVLIRTISGQKMEAPSEEANEWEIEFSTYSTWTLEKLEKFLAFLNLPNADHSIFYSVNEDVLAFFRELDHDCWNDLVEFFLAWSEGSFGFAYCDVLIGRLEKIYQIGSVGQKAAATLVAAKLGSSHNRWYVMNRVIYLTDKSIDRTLAQRIAIEIRVQGYQEYFLRCAEVISKDISDFHEIIAEVLI